VANSQHRLYFTYNGGPVFNLSSAKYESATPAPTSAEPESTAPDSSNSGDAAQYSRRGEAFAARHDFEQALANLTRACELAPDNAEYLHQRGVIYWQLKQDAAAMADFDQALKLKPDDVDALVSRAELALQGADRLRARADLDAANAAASKQADVRFAMARDYQGAGLADPAIAQYDLWVTWHADDARMPEALNSRCWVRALTGVDLVLALKDCDAALKRADKSSPLYARIANSRGLVLLRMGDYDKSISDYDAALKISPKNPWSWYGRGIDQLRKRKISEGQADIAQATSIWPKIAEEFNRHGIAQ
jgi:tetratricopeptide (TPR) repeat protein